MGSQPTAYMPHMTQDNCAWMEHKIMNLVKLLREFLCIMCVYMFVYVGAFM